MNRVHRYSKRPADVGFHCTGCSEYKRGQKVVIARRPFCVACAKEVPPPVGYGNLGRAYEGPVQLIKWDAGL